MSEETVCEAWECDMEPTYSDQTVVHWQCTRCGKRRTDYIYQ